MTEKTGHHTLRTYDLKHHWSAELYYNTDTVKRQCRLHIYQRGRHRYTLIIRSVRMGSFMSDEDWMFATQSFEADCNKLPDEIDQVLLALDGVPVSASEIEDLEGSLRYTQRHGDDHHDMTTIWTHEISEPVLTVMREHRAAAVTAAAVLHHFALHADKP